MTDPTDHPYAPSAGHVGRCSVCSHVEMHAFHMPAPATARVMTDPAEIDLGPYKQRRAKRYPDEDGPYDGPIEDSDEDIDDLIAAVEALRKKAFNAYSEGWSTAHEPAPCGHARANHKDPKFGTPEYKGNEKCEACTEVETLRERVAKLTGCQWLDCPECGEASKTDTGACEVCGAYFSLANFNGMIKQIDADWRRSTQTAKAHAAELAGALTWYQADDERAVEGGVLESVFDRPATTVLAAMADQALKRARAMREAAIEQACGHLGSAISQSIASDDHIIMDHVKAAYEILKLVRDGDRKAHDPSPAEARLERVGHEGPRGTGR